jgi:hypothetical protein
MKYQMSTSTQTYRQLNSLESTLTHCSTLNTTSISSPKNFHEPFSSSELLKTTTPMVPGNPFTISLFHSNLIYGIHVWSCAPPSTYSCIFLKQKMALRIVHDAAYNSDTEPLFKNAGVLLLLSLIEFFILQFVQRFIQGFLPISFNNTWITNAVRGEEDYQLELRNDADLYVPFARTALIERQPLTKFPKTWHEFPTENVKFIRNKQTFNEELKKHFLSKLDANNRCVRLLCPHFHPPDGTLMLKQIPYHLYQKSYQ